MCAELRVVCVECEPEMDICLDCFAGAVTVGQHRPYHKYRFEESTRFPILTGDWNAGELFQLLEGIEQFGYGNWNDVSRDVGTKGPTECRDAVNQSFVDGPIGSRTYEEKNRGNAVDHTPKPAPTAGKKETDLSINDMLALGWLPNRDEFEVEHCNEAETLVSSLDQGKNDEVEDEVESALKLSQVEMYQAKLKDRERRRQTAADHDLITQFFIEQNTYKPKKKDGKPDLLDRLKLVSNFQTVPEHKTFMSNMGREKELKSRIKELNRYRKNGVTRSKDGEEFDLQRLRRNKIKTERKKALEAGIDIPPSLLEHPQGGIDLDTITNISILPGYDLLSLNEKRLCSSLRLHPNLYNAYKTCIIRDNAMKRRGHIIRPSNPSGLDKLHRKKIMNFLLQSGWISAY
ncbi:transcriptional adapter 2-beta isoform X2 [Eurytemora carolleeae]|uniref:transcriptional adapter 2-beta isoform X2 n=1 Tax=Eurytemora carolleeae TaxID=1294199 RepID=UPI000C79465A|nr:transcriptional adapter 2-beta isoform X2 [Eurytemora carolleeae]|eukprot:XP_023320922.1 transcriptional adapter 2-beta-like isoform X2 [Eurytemora affinis]